MKIFQRCSKKLTIIFFNKLCIKKKWRGKLKQPLHFLHSEVMYVKRYRHLYLLSCTLLICFVALSLSYHTACIEKFDNVVAHFIQSFRNEYLTTYFTWVSFIGSKEYISVTHYTCNVFSS